jgi:hypothetical protein
MKKRSTITACDSVGYHRPEGSQWLGTAHRGQKVTDPLAMPADPRVIRDGAWVTVAVPVDQDGGGAIRDVRVGRAAC